MKYLIFLLCNLVFSLANATGWNINPKENRVEIRSDSGDEILFFSYDSQEGGVWGSFKLVGLDRFSSPSKIIFRIDKSDSKEFGVNSNVSLNGRMILRSWKASSDQVSFRFWHGIPGEGCGMFKNLAEADQVTIRFYPFNSPAKDAFFNVSQGREKLLKFFNLNLKDCK